MRRVLLRSCFILAATLVFSFGAVEIVNACADNETSCSTTYGVSETYFGNGGSLCAPGDPNSENSTTYCAKTAIGEAAVGNPVGTAYQAQAGFNTDRTPSLTLVVNNPSCTTDYHAGGVNIDLGYLSTASTIHYNANFSVYTYLASGYQAVTYGLPPQSNGPSVHTLNTPTGGASAGTEKFGINLWSNTGFGSQPQQLPDSTFSFGSVAAGYGTTDSFKYNSGDTIAQSTKSSGTTCYDMSYVFDISNVTPAGTYRMTQTIVATSTF